MKLLRVEARADAIGQRAVADSVQRILRRAKPPRDVTLEAVGGGVTITGKRLRRRMIDDPRLRNFAHE